MRGGGRQVVPGWLHRTLRALGSMAAAVICRRDSVSELVWLQVDSARPVTLRPGTG